MASLSSGTRLRSEFGYDVCVLEELGAGGQGVVYKVMYGNEPKAFKWYYPDRVYKKERFVANLRRNVLAGPPTPDFLWPMDLISLPDGSFGYIMNLSLEGFYEVDELLMNPSRLVPSYKRLVDACLHIVTAFRTLHGSGYCYQDLNGGNFFIKPTTGEVLICDNDNVAPGGTNMGMLGHPDYMAPEIVVGKTLPNVKTDLHSLAVLMSYLLLMAHPLVGIRGRIRDRDSLMRMYGTEPLFIFDPNDHRNAPIQCRENFALQIWPYLPKHMQDIFVRAFSQEALHNPNYRPSEVDWLRELVRFRSEIVTCGCGNEVFMQDTSSCRCEQCHAPIEVPLRLELVNNAGRAMPLVPVIPDARVYTCQIARSDASTALDPVMWMLASKRRRAVGIRNISQTPWESHLNDEMMQVDPGVTVVAVAGMKMNVPGMRKGEYLRVVSNED